jgi:hypothetical protein
VDRAGADDKKEPPVITENDLLDRAARLEYELGLRIAATDLRQERMRRGEGLVFYDMEIGYSAH